MLSQRYKAMLANKSVIMELSARAAERSRKIGEDNVFDFTLGNPSVPTPAAYNERIKELLTTLPGKLVHGYSQGLGRPEPRVQIAASLNRRFGMDYQPEDLFMSLGAAGAVAHAIRLVTEPGDEIVTFAPHFPEYRPYVELADRRLTVVPARPVDFQIHFDALEAMMTPKVQAVLINTPSNPSGVVYSAETLTRLANFLLEKEKVFGHELWLISDEPYREILFDGAKPLYVAKFYPRTLSCYSFSKSLSVPGDRIGYLAVNPASGVSAQMAAMAAQVSRGIGQDSAATVIQLAVGDCCDLTADFTVYERNMNLLYDELTALGFEIVRPGGTFYMFPKALEEDATVFCQKALKHDIVLVPGDSFGINGYFRIAYCMPTEKVERSLTAWRQFVHAEYGR